MTTLLDSMPEWFATLLGEASEINRGSVFESLLDIGRVLATGEEGEARRLGLQLHGTIELLKGGLPVEDEGSQLEAMLKSRLYPKDLCETIQSRRNGARKEAY